MIKTSLRRPGGKEGSGEVGKWGSGELKIFPSSHLPNFLSSIFWTPRKSFLLKENYIYRLVNSVLYSMDHAFIHCQEKEFRLVAFHQNKVYWNKNYKSLQEAKNAFLNEFQHKALNDSIQPEWSHKYNVYKYWLKDKYKHIAMSQRKKRPKQKKPLLVDRLIQNTPREIHSPGAPFPLTARENPNQPLKAYEYR